MFIEAIYTEYVCIYVYTNLDSREKSKRIKGKRNDKTQNWARSGRKQRMYCMYMYIYIYIYNTYNFSPARVPLSCSEKEEMCYDFTS